MLQWRGVGYHPMKISSVALLLVVFFVFAPTISVHADTGLPSTVMNTSWYKAPTYNGVAHRKLRKGTILRIENPATGATAWGVVNDRGPYIKGRDLDVSAQIARTLGITGQGVAKLKVMVVYTPTG